MRGIVTIVALSWAVGPATAQANFPPVARASASPEEVFAGETVTLSAAASFDPDDAPSPLAFSWELGGGVSASGPLVTHVFDAPGAYHVTVTVSDGLATSAAGLTVYVLAEVAPSPPRSSSPIALSADGGLLVAANPDSGTVTFVDVSASFETTEIPVCDEPVAVALGDADAEALVACGDGEIVALDTGSRTERARARVAVRLASIVVVPSAGQALVAASSEDEVLVVDLATLGVTARIPTTEPRAIALDPSAARAWVTTFLTRGEIGSVTEIDLGTHSVRTIPLAVDPGPDTPSSGAGYPNLLSTIAIDPAGRRAWVGGLKANTARGMYLSGEALIPTNRLRGLAMPIDLVTGEEVLARRIDTNDADHVSAIAFSPRGRFAFLTHPGIGALSIYDLAAAESHDASDGDALAAVSRIDIGDAPAGVAVSPDGTRLYVWAELSRDVAVVDVTDPRAPSVLGRVALTTEPLAPEVALGKRMFHRSSAPVHSRDGYIACASCHPGGGHDGRTWDFTEVGEGLRNTIDLRGRGGVGHGPVHWSANFDEIQDFENDIVHAFEGTGLANDGAPPHPPLDSRPNAGRSAELDALAAYVATLTEAPRSPHRGADGVLGPSAERGRALFEDPAVGCADCHVPPRFTDSTLTGDPATFVLHDVGTLGEGSGSRLGGALTGLDTPTLLGVWATAPYLHDGSAPTLRAVLIDRNAGDRHGRTSHLSEAQIDDLIAYLLALDGPGVPSVPPPDAGVDPDAGPAPDAALPGRDAGAGAGVPPADAGSGCACRATSADDHRASALALLFCLISALAFRRRT